MGREAGIVCSVLAFCCAKMALIAAPTYNSSIPRQKKSSNYSTMTDWKITSKYAQQMLLACVIAVSVYFWEYRMVSMQVQRSVHHSMSIFEIEEAVTQHTVQQQQQQILSSNSTITHQSMRPDLQLPMFNETGGLVVFLHIAKTGGTTVRNAFMEFPNVHVARFMNEKQLSQRISQVDWFLSANNGKNRRERVLLLEIHGRHGEPMSALQMHPYIKKWRARAAANNKKFFVFTLLREPTAFYVSYFNYFKHPDCTLHWCDPPLVALTEENLVKTMVPNHQCQYLARKRVKAETMKRALPLSREECESMYTLLKADVDWIGTTESMQETTLPLLAYMFSGNAARGQEVAVYNKRQHTNQVTVEGLGADALRSIGEKATYDQFLYDSVVKDFSLDMWQNYATEHARSSGKLGNSAEVASR
jgi:hypothetical protein